jgi:DNA-binding transcriptional LysR family regulator
MGLDPRHLLAFRAVARRGGFGRAAREIGRSQPTVTLAIQTLERELGVRLLDRMARGARLTAAGQALLDRAGPLLEELERLPALLREASGGRLEGPVRVGAGEGPVLYLLPRPLQAFRRRHPGIRVVVRNQPVEDTLAMLQSGELDFGLRTLERVPAGLEYRPALTFDRLLIGRRGHPALRARRPAMQDLARHAFVMPWPRSTTRRLVERTLRARGLEPEVAVEAGGWAIIKRYVAAGLGVAVVPSFCLEAGDARALAARSVTHLFGPDAYGIVTRRDRPLSRAAGTLVRLIAPGLPVKDG